MLRTKTKPLLSRHRFRIQGSKGSQGYKGSKGPQTLTNRLFVSAIKIYVISYCFVSCVAFGAAFCAIGYVASDLFQGRGRVYMWPNRNDD